MSNWCPHCRMFVSGSTCPLCGGELKTITPKEGLAETIRNNNEFEEYHKRRTECQTETQ